MPGNRYTVRTSNGTGVCGPGLIANEHVGAFNLYWALTRPPEPNTQDLLQHSLKHLKALAGLIRLSERVVEDYPISEWAVVYKPQEFARWLSEHAHLIQDMPDLGATRYGRISTPKQFAAAMQIAVAFAD